MVFGIWSNKTASQVTFLRGMLLFQSTSWKSGKSEEQETRKKENSEFFTLILFLHLAIPKCA